MNLIELLIFLYVHEVLLQKSVGAFSGVLASRSHLHFRKDLHNFSFIKMCPGFESSIKKLMFPIFQSQMVAFTVLLLPLYPS